MKKIDRRKFRPRMRLAEFEAYASFLALPYDERKKVFGFYLDNEFAKRYNLNQATLVKWKKDEEFWRLRDEYLKDFKKYTANVIKSLYKGIIEKKSASEVMAWFKLVEGKSEGLSEDKSSFIFINLIKDAFIQIDQGDNQNLIEEPERPPLVSRECLEGEFVGETERDSKSSTEQ